ncbi:MAG: hypothetical protein H0M93_00970 [Methanophagales archaeon]|nr:hypothetical protein [Methanophagales archaeon]
MDIATLLLLVITMVLIMALGLFGISGIYGGLTMKGSPKTIDLEFLKRHSSEKEREVKDEDREKVWRYTSTGLMKVGLNGNSKLTAGLTERGKRVIK